MEKQKRWQFAIILIVFALTLYNILPTIIYYSKPLKSPITEKRAEAIAHDIAHRVNQLEHESKEWLASFCNLLQITPKSIQDSVQDPSIIEVTFSNEKDASLFRKFLPVAGLEIPFVPAQLGLIEKNQQTQNVQVARRIGVRLYKNDIEKLFRFSAKRDLEDRITPFYFELTSDRFVELACNLNGGAPLAQEIEMIVDDKEDKSRAIMDLAEKILRVVDGLGEKNPIVMRYFKTFAQTNSQNQRSLINRLITKFEDEKKAFQQKKTQISEVEKAKQSKGELVSTEEIESAAFIASQIQTLERALQVLRQNSALTHSAPTPITKEEVVAFLQNAYKKNKSANALYTFQIGDRHPLFKELVLDWENDYMLLRLHPDVQALRDQVDASENTHIQQDMLNRWIMNDVAQIAQITDEAITAEAIDFRVNLYKLPSSRSLLALDLEALATKYLFLTMEQIQAEWKPTHPDLAVDRYPRLTGEAYSLAPFSQKKLCIAIVAPSAKEPVMQGLRRGSIYVILRGLESIIDQYEHFSQSPEAKQFSEEFGALSELLQKRGFIGYSGKSLGLSSELSHDYIFELNDYYSTLLKATREDFYVLGGKRFATLDFSDVEQRILTQNRIDDAVQEDLVKWKEAYQAAQVDLNHVSRFTVPKPTKSAFLENIKLGARKYFRGDDSKILRWGLDLSGGKSVRIALIDHSGHEVKEPQEMKQAVNELYTRINKMGVSERTIRVENSTILIDFPGSQGLSAAELIKGSAMYFHVANERFGPLNKALAKEVHEFLQDVWNEAVVTNRQDIESINEIAYQKLEFAATRERTFGPKAAVQVLYEKGLRFANPKDGRASSAFDDSFSMLAKYRGNEIGEWSNQTNPLLIVFKNYALEGSSLEHIQAAFDPSKGNVLLFDVKSSYAKESSGGSSNPRDDFYAWTSQFSEEGINGTAREAYSQGRGWRMAVVLNGSVISAPSLNASLRDHAMISGSFSQREVTKLATDLRAGSLSFSPKILSEQNISPELGEQERHKGIVAAIIAVILVICTMVGYYRLAGIVASVAVLVNVLIIWAVMQNLDAALTLPGIAGMVLTVGMAVDANVLVFERIREEFKISKRIASAIQAGYQKAFSAILDSNLTTILAAIILLQFDCGPIKGFATTLIIGITSSMFTALFMTRYFFAGWVQNPEHRELKMAEWIRPTGFNFLKVAKPAFILSAVLFAAGAFIFANNWKSMIGMDFTGGYSLVVELDNKATKELPEKVMQALRKANIGSQEVQIRELGRPDLLRIQLGVSLEEAGHPFHNMPQELNDGTYTYEFQSNPRINYVVDALESQGLHIKPSQLSTLNHNWTAMSGQFSDTMRNNAIIALALSLIGVLIYIAFRFEWKYAVSSVLALLHDVLLTLAVMAIANRIGMPVQLNLETIGAIMTIIGYSLNDTIIVFDRIREDIRLLRKKSFAEIINYALNQTLSRTLLTSGTTLIVLLSLDFFAGTAIFGFAFIMTVGVFLGTLSSLFIASPILLWLHDREEAKIALKYS